MKGRILLLVFFGCLVVWGYAPLERGNVPKVWDFRAVDTNEVYLPLTNYGIIGHDVDNGTAGAYWPSGYPNETYIFGSGFWVGAIRMRYDDSLSEWVPDTNIARGYLTGSGESEFIPGLNPEDADSPDVKLYFSTDPDWTMGEVISDLETYCWYSETVDSLQFSDMALGVLVEQWTYCWTSPWYNQDVIYFRWRVINVGDSTLYLSLIHI